MEMVLGGTPNVIGWVQTPRKSTDLEQYIILDIKKFVQLQKLAKLQQFQNFLLGPNIFLKYPLLMGFSYNRLDDLMRSSDLCRLGELSWRLGESSRPC